MADCCVDFICELCFKLCLEIICTPICEALGSLCQGCVLGCRQLIINCLDEGKCCKNKKEKREEVNNQNNADLNYCEVEMETIMDQPRLKPNSSPINHRDIGESEGGHLGTRGNLETTSHGTYSGAMDSNDHPPSYDQAISE